MKDSSVHFEILVEDQSGKKALEILIPKLIGNNHSFKVHAYKGIGVIPKNIGNKSDPKNRILMEQLPRLLRGYGKAFANYSEDYPAAVILICDLDKKCLKEFRLELLQVLDDCDPKPQTRFCIAIEEFESWFLGDIVAIKKAYPKAKESVLEGYKNDSICNTWEVLADAVFRGGSIALGGKGWQAIGAEKSAWSQKITPHIDPERNLSPSFQYFRKKILELSG